MSLVFVQWHNVIQCMCQNNQLNPAIERFCVLLTGSSQHGSSLRTELLATGPLSILSEENYSPQREFILINYLKCCFILINYLKCCSSDFKTNYIVSFERSSIVRWLQKSSHPHWGAQQTASIPSSCSPSFSTSLFRDCAKQVTYRPVSS